MSRLTKATCPNCGAQLQLDPTLEFAACGYCGTRSFVQTKRRPVTEEIRIQHQPVIQVHVAPWGCLPSIISTLVLMLVGGAWLYFNGQGLPFRQWMSSIPGLPSVVPSSLASALASNGIVPSADVDYFADATGALRVFEERLGSPIRALRLVLYPTYAVLEAQDPKHKENVDDYNLMSGTINEVSPVRLDSDQSKFEQKLFSISQSSVSQIPALIRASQSEMGIPDGAPSHVIIEREFMGSPPPPVIRVYITSPRADGYVEYSLDGKKRRVIK